MLNIITLNTAVPLPRFLKTLFLSTFLLLYQGTAVQATNPFLDSDVNKSGVVDATDALLIYYVLNFDTIDDDAALRNRLMVDQTGSYPNDDTGFKQIIANAKKWASNTDYDINKSGEVNATDALLMYYVLNYRATIDVDAALRNRLMVDKTGRFSNDDTGFKQIIAKAKEWADKRRYDVNIDGVVDIYDSGLVQDVKWNGNILHISAEIRESVLGGGAGDLRSWRRYMRNLEQITPYLKNLKLTNPERYEEKRKLVERYIDDIRDYEYLRIIRHVRDDLFANTSEAYETDEYNGQKYYKDLGNGKLTPLNRINASSMYVRGGTGYGVTVGVIDRGASPLHPDLAGKYVYIGSMEGVDPIDSNGHGTHVAGIIAAKRNDLGIHGVAYDAKIASYARASNRDFPFPDRLLSNKFDEELAKGIDKMREMGGLITNNSWGPDVDVTATSALQIEGPPNYMPNEHPRPIAYIPNSLPAYEEYVRAGGVQVWAAKNDSEAEIDWLVGLPYHFKDLEKGWLAVVSVGHDGELASNSSKCGVAANWCLAAPGETGTTAGYTPPCLYLPSLEPLGLCPPNPEPLSLCLPSLCPLRLTATVTSVVHPWQPPLSRGPWRD